MTLSCIPKKTHIAISIADILYTGKKHPFNAVLFYFSGLCWVGNKYVIYLCRWDSVYSQCRMMIIKVDPHLNLVYMLNDSVSLKYPTLCQDEELENACTASGWS
jgi:hypothetical protein